MSDTTGRTKDAGYEIGVSKTLPYPVAHVWELITSPDGIALWLGPGAVLTATKGTAYATDDGTTGEVRSYHDLDRVRLTSRPAGWDHDTTVQVTVSTTDAGRTTLRFHQEWLTGTEERVRQRAHWKDVMAAVEQALATPNE